MMTSKKVFYNLLLVMMLALLVACGTEDSSSDTDTGDTTAETSDADTEDTAAEADPDAQSFTVTSVGGVDRTITQEDALREVRESDGGQFNIIFRDSSRDFVMGLNFSPDTELAVGEFVFDDTSSTPVSGSFSAATDDGRVTGVTESGTVTFTEYGEEASGTFEFVFSLGDDVEDVTVTGTFNNILLLTGE
ncbi:MAG: hypothetical protein AAFV98_10185 [Chloroflexota bacterium]